jgi:hypothetical protein
MPNRHIALAIYISAILLSCVSQIQTPNEQVNDKLPIIISFRQDWFTHRRVIEFASTNVFDHLPVIFIDNKQIAPQTSGPNFLWSHIIESNKTSIPFSIRYQGDSISSLFQTPAVIDSVHLDNRRLNSNSIYPISRFFSDTILINIFPSYNSPHKLSLAFRERLSNSTSSQVYFDTTITSNTLTYHFNRNASVTSFVLTISSIVPDSLTLHNFKATETNSTLLFRHVSPCTYEYQISKAPVFIYN